MDALELPAFLPTDGGVTHFFGTRQRPASLVDTVKAGQIVSVPPAYPFVMSLKQVHGTRVVVVDDATCEMPGGLPEGDALVTRCRDVLLVVRTADCVPVLLADLAAGVIAAVHAGWRGAVAGIVEETVSAMQRNYGTDARDIRVAIGPSIGPCCFEVDEPVIAPLRERYPAAHDVVRLHGPSTGMLDLKRLIRHQAAALGVPEASIAQSGACTSCETHHFFSYRRDGRVNGTMVSGMMIRRTSTDVG